MGKLITIERHILEQQKYYPGATGTFTALMYDIALAAKLIASHTTRAGLADILGAAGTTNVQGEDQAKLDVFANNILIHLLDHTGRIAIMASEEADDPIEIPDKYPTGNYVVLFDPLDGSSNIDFNISIGTIFSIHRKVSAAERGSMADLLQPGYRQIAAGYVVYGSSTMLVYTAGRGVHGFTLDPAIGEFLLSHPGITIPSTSKHYSVNQGYEKYWSEGVKRYVKWITGQEEGDENNGLSLRYIGSMVADFHRTLLSGGIFMYPADSKDPEKPHGKLRLTYECAPLAFIAEQAGGAATDGTQSTLNIQPFGLHQRTPFFVGEARLVAKVGEYIQTYDTEWIETYRAAQAAELAQGHVMGD